MNDSAGLNPGCCSAADSGLGQLDLSWILILGCSEIARNPKPIQRHGLKTRLKLPFLDIPQYELGQMQSTKLIIRTCAYLYVLQQLGNSTARPWESMHTWLWTALGFIQTVLSAEGIWLDHYHSGVCTGAEIWGSSDCLCSQIHAIISRKKGWTERDY